MGDLGTIKQFYIFCEFYVSHTTFSKYSLGCLNKKDFAQKHYSQ